MTPRPILLKCARCGWMAPVHPVLGIACPCAAWDKIRISEWFTGRYFPSGGNVIYQHRKGHA